MLRVAIWIIGEYSISQSEVDQAFDSVKRNIGTLPIFVENKEEDAKPAETEDTPKTITKTIILPDGSYGTETIVLDDPSKANAQNLSEDHIPLRKALKNGTPMMTF